MGKNLRIALYVLGGLLLAAVVILVVLYRASQQVPEFYKQALAADQHGQEKASDKMIQQATALSSDIQREGRWHAVFSADEVNGWLAVDLARNYADSLPPNLHDPRVVIELDGITLGCRVEQGGLSMVVTLKVDVYLEAPNVVALRIRKARAGAIPWPLEKTLKGISEAARRADLQIRQGMADRDPVVLVTIAPTLKRGKVARIDKIQLGQGEVYVAGTTERKK